MRKTIIRILDAIGIYNFFLTKKRAYDRRIFEKSEKKNHRYRITFYSAFLSQGDLVFDVGANVGNRIQVFLELGCEVIAIEPQEECIIELKKKFGSAIKIIEKGLGEKEEKKTLFISDANTISSLSEEWIESVKTSRFKNHEWNKSVEIELTTLDNLITEFGIPKFCKIDVEGFELEVLKGLHQPIPLMSLEYTVPEQTGKLIECVQYCNQLNQESKFNYSVEEKMKLELEEFLPYEQFLALIQEKRFQKTGFGDIYVKN